MGEGEGEDFIFYGTPIEREEDTSARKRKSIADAGQLRSLPAWKQEVLDEEGRRRFHGAFTGGYSAGYYNTVGSKEGWTPQTFTSSRKNRAEAKKQSIYNFLDDDDMKDMGGHALETSSQFDTFGFTAADVARKQAEKEQQKRPLAIPGPIPDEIVLPATNSIGVKLLVKMGWRVGHAIKEANTNSLYDARREARKAFLAFSGNEENSEPSPVELSNDDIRNITERCDDNAAASQSTPVYVLHPKQDLHGLGYDPFEFAPEFRDRKRLRDSRCNDKGSKTDASTRSKISGKYAPGFGIGALEELDIEDEDIYASGFDYVGTEVEEEEPSRVITDNKLKLGYRKKGVLSGFKVASSSDYNLERFHPPVIPPDFEPYHKFTSPSETLDEFAESPPPEVPPPEDNSLRLLIDGFATLVARCGKIFEDLSKEKNKSNPLFSFLSGGNGNGYYARKLWEAKQKSVQQRQEVRAPSDRKMTAESRGKFLGEKPLDRSTKDSTTSVAHKEVVLQSNLTDTFAKPKSTVDFSERAKPFGDDPAKQERFEQFLKDKYQGGLRSTYAGSASSMSENDRARERLDFEAAAEAIEKGEWNTKTNIPSSLHVIDLLGRDDHFISSSAVEKHQILKVEEKVDKLCPKREEFQWRPSPILCKRFDLIDPFMGKPPPAPRARSKLDTLIFMPDSFPNVKSAETDAKRDSSSTSQSEPQESNKIKDPDVETDTARVQRPVDLYKAIFSDDSDDEVDNVSVSNNVAEDPEKKIEGVNKTLNRLVAGDFLESLGKELGLEVPPANTTSSGTLTETTNGTNKTSPNNEKSAQMEDDKIEEPPNITGTNSATRADTRRRDRSSSPTKSDGREGKAKAERREHRSKKHRSRSRHRAYDSTSDPGSTSDGEYYDRSQPRSKRQSRRHSDHHRHKRSRSPRYSRRDKDRDRSDDGRMDRKSRDGEKHSRKKYR